MTTEAQNLNELRYIIELTTPDGHVDTYYYVNGWPNPELRILAKDPESDIDVYSSVYLSTTLTNAFTFNNIDDAIKAANFIPRSYVTNVKPVSAKVFFMARLMG